MATPRLPGREGKRAIAPPRAPERRFRSHRLTGAEAWKLTHRAATRALPPVLPATGRGGGGSTGSPSRAKGIWPPTHVACDGRGGDRAGHPEFLGPWEACHRSAIGPVLLATTCTPPAYVSAFTRQLHRARTSSERSLWCGITTSPLRCHSHFNGRYTSVRVAQVLHEHAVPSTSTP